MAAAFAHELGVFDPTFPGITLHFENEATWDQVQRVSYLSFKLGVKDMLEKNPGMSETEATPERLMQHLAASVENGHTSSPEEKDAMGRQFMARDPDNAIGNLALASVFEHERRHFHDWLLSPYTAAINAIRAEVFLNYAQLRRVLEASGTTVVPVPLTRWLRKSPGEQRELVAMWQSLLPEGVEVRLPDLTLPGVAEAIATIERRYRSIGVLFTPVGAEGLDAASVFEASALLIQTQAIHDFFGETASNAFLSTMAEQGGASRYGWFLKTLNGLRRPGEIFENDTMSAIATWCLLGNNSADPDHAHPLVRLGHAVRCVQKHGLSAMDGPTRTIMKMLDESAVVMPHEQLLRESVRMGDSVVRMFEQMIAGEAAGSRFVLGVAESYAFLHRCHTYMVNLFLKDPDGYCQPVAYLDRNLENLPEPPRRHTFGRPFHRVRRASLDKLDRVSLFEAESNAEEAVLRQHIVQPPRGVVDLQIADNWQYLCGLADTVFAEYNRDHPEIQAQRDLARERGRYLMEVLC